jgi:uncharacterized membrane protein (Fun14 family)
MFLYLLVLNYLLSIDIISCFKLRDLDDLPSQNENSTNSLSNEQIIFPCNKSEPPTNQSDLIEQCKKNYPKKIFCKEDDFSHCTCVTGYVNGFEYNKNLDDKNYCDYKQKKQLTAFLLELFVGFGAGHFYRGNYLMASLKLVAFLIGIYIICLFPLTAKWISDCCDCDCLVVIVSILFYFAACGLATWFIFDLVYFGKNKYKDKNDVPLLKW